MAYTYNYSLMLTLLNGTAEMSTESYAETKQSVTETTKLMVSVPDDASDQVVSLGGIETVKTVLIKSDQTVSIKFNSLDAITGKLFFLKGTTVTSIKVSNNSGSAATLHVMLTD